MTNHQKTTPKKHAPDYDFSAREKYWQSFWEQEKIYEFDPDSPKPTFTVDTPPPTISGNLHLGHVFSYTQAEIVARFKRMSGLNIRFPFGLDDNGLPTERLVEKERGIRGQDMDLSQFTKICLEITQKYKHIFESLWKSLGFSYDWRLEYSTISPQVQRISQSAFLELFKTGKIYRQQAPSLYCHECRTSIAQAEVEDIELDSVFYDISFQTENKDSLIISTTRPELLPACVAVFVHPDDKRYSKLTGSKVTTPLGEEVTVLADDVVQMEKGSGAVMCCTYGDETDMKWARKYNLPEKVVITPEGKIGDKSIKLARKEIVEKLEREGNLVKETPIRHNVGVHERCSTPIEIIPTTQWFVKILEMKRQLLEAGNKIHWRPPHMQKRYTEWVTGLKWDWCISRDRFFGVPIPAYICRDCSEINLPDEADLPIDPKDQEYKKSCQRCKSRNINPERYMLDTWFTSSLTPDFNNAHPLNGTLQNRMLPMSMRPQAHDIIRTWAVYTILMSLYRHNDIPWKELMISGHILVKKGEKISKKTGGGHYKPEDLIRENSADVVRYAMCSAGLGKDAYFDENQLKDGGKLIIKLINATKFVLVALNNYVPGKAAFEHLFPIDQWIIFQSRQTAAKIQKELDKYEFGLALQTFERFFWADFTDNYLEIIKGRIYEGNEKEKRSAQSALYASLLNILKMIAPFLPHISEELYHANVLIGPQKTVALESNPGKGFFSGFENTKSIHISSWPTTQEKIFPSEESLRGVAMLLTAVSEVRKFKSAKNLRLGQDMGTIAIKGETAELALFKRFAKDLKSVSRAREILLVPANNQNPTTSDLQITI